MKRFGLNTDLIKLGQEQGLEYYQHQLTEECAELIQALNKNWRCKRGNDYLDADKVKDNLFEEIADVEICISILKNLLKCEEEVYEWKRRKVQRTIKRLGIDKDIID